MMGGACPICFRALEGIGQTTTPCGHVFCTSCIVEATARSVQGRSCPMCRTPFPSGYMDMPADELTSYLLRVRSRHAQTAGRHVVRFAYGNSVLPLKVAQGGSRWCAFFRVDGSATSRGRRLTESDYIERCEFVVHHGSRDERVVVTQPPYELRRNSISSAALGDGSRRSASPMIGVMIELRVVWRSCCNQRDLTLHLAIDLQGATHSCSVDFDSAPAPRRAMREQQPRSSELDGAARLSTGGVGSGRPDAERQPHGQTTQLIQELENMRVERANLLRAKATLEEAMHEPGASPFSDPLVVVNGRTGSAEGRRGGHGRSAVPDSVGRVMGRGNADLGRADAGGSNPGGALARRLGVGRQLRAAVEASEARERARLKKEHLTAKRSVDRGNDGHKPRSGVASERANDADQHHSGVSSRSVGRDSTTGRSRSAPSVTAGQRQPEPEPVKKRAADPQRLSRLAQPTPVKQALEHSAQELADLRRGYARQGLPRQPYSDEIIAEHGLTFLGLGATEDGSTIRTTGVGGADVRRAKDITRMRNLLATGTAGNCRLSRAGSETDGSDGSVHKRTPSSGRRSSQTLSSREDGEGARDRRAVDGAHLSGTRTRTRPENMHENTVTNAAMVASAVTELEIAGGRSLPRAARRFVAEAVQEKSLRDEREAFRFH